MAQNSQRLTWTREDVDKKLKDIMTTCYNISLDAGTTWTQDDLSGGKIMPSLLTGANVAGFIKVADAMKVCMLALSIMSAKS
jgi:glutamate dehydrogenase (NADP+)